MPKSGRPVSKGRVQRNYQFDKGLASFIDDLPNGSRSDFVASLVELGLKQKLRLTLERFLASPDFRDAALSSSISSKDGDECRLEIFPDGSWRKLYYAQNEFAQTKYEAPGAILLVPPLDCAEMAQGGTQEEKIAQALRDQLE